MCRISLDSDLLYKASEFNVGEIHQTLPMQPEQQQDVVPAGSQKLDDQSVCNMERTGDLHDSTDGSITQNSKFLEELRALCLFNDWTDISFRSFRAAIHRWLSQFHLRQIDAIDVCVEVFRRGQRLAASGEVQIRNVPAWARRTAFTYIRELSIQQKRIDKTNSVAALLEPAKSWDQECIGLNRISVRSGIVQHPKVDLLNDRNWKLETVPNNSDHSPKFRKLDLVKRNKSQLEDKLVLLCAQVVERLVNPTIRDEAIGDILELHQGMKLRKKPIVRRLSMTLWSFISLIEGSLRMSVAGWFESFVHPSQDDENSGGHRFNVGLFACLAVLGMTTWIVGATNNLTLKDYGIEAPLLHQVKSVR